MSKLHKKNSKVKHYSASFSNAIAMDKASKNKEIARANVYQMLYQFFFETLSWKFDFSKRKLTNFNQFLDQTMMRFESDAAYVRLAYQKQKKIGIDVNERPKNIYYKEKLKIAGVTSLNNDVLKIACNEFNNVYTSYMLAVIAVLKKNYSFSEANIRIFIDYIDFLVNNFYLGNIPTVTFAHGLWRDKGFVVPGYEKMAENSFQNEIERGCV